MTSCHVSEKEKTGPVASHTATVIMAIPKAIGWPDATATQLANFPNVFVMDGHPLDFVGGPPPVRGRRSQAGGAQQGSAQGGKLTASCARTRPCVRNRTDSDPARALACKQV